VQLSVLLSWWWDIPAQSYGTCSPLWSMAGLQPTDIFGGAKRCNLLLYLTNTHVFKNFGWGNCPIAPLWLRAWFMGNCIACSWLICVNKHCFCLWYMPLFCNDKAAALLSAAKPLLFNCRFSHLLQRWARIRTGSDCNFFENWRIRTGSDWENFCYFNVIILKISKILVMIWFHRFAKW